MHGSYLGGFFLNRLCEGRKASVGKAVQSQAWSIGSLAVSLERFLETFDNAIDLVIQCGRDALQSSAIPVVPFPVKDHAADLLLFQN